MRGSRGGGTGGPDLPPPLKNHKNIGFRSSTGPDPQKNHEATKPAFHNGPLSARQRNAIKISFLWRADDGPLIVVFGSSHLNQTNVFSVGSHLAKLKKKKKKKKKNRQCWNPSGKTFC